MPRTACMHCTWWDNSIQAANVDYESGACRRAPPGHDDRSGLAVWPFTEDTDWCGEFKLDPDKLEEGEDDER